MVDSFDSRALRSTDCYAQRFMKIGTYHYNVLPVGGHCVTEERPFSVKVTERAAKTRMAQRSVVVKADRGRFSVDRDEVTIEAGDLVMWNCADTRAMPYMVVGEKEFFGSHRLLNESGYSHAFGWAGEYRWRDAYGSRAAGVVRVKNPGCRSEADFQGWRKSLAKGTVVMITDGRAEPEDVEIVTGQTVFFAVTKGPGVSITDHRLLAPEGGKQEGRPARREAQKARK